MSQATATRPNITLPAEDAPLLDRVLDATLNRMDAYAQRVEREIHDPATGRLRQAAMMAQAIDRLRATFTPELMGLLRSLVNSPLGFLTDKGPGTRKVNENYPDETIRDCAIEALLKGFWWTGNEFNVINGRVMGVLAGWLRKCQEIPGITDLKVRPGMPTVRDGAKMAVRVAASWKINGVADQLVGTDGNPGMVFYPPQSSGSSDDNNIGKALRRAYKAIYEQATGTAITEPDESWTAANGGDGRAEAKLNGNGDKPTPVKNDAEALEKADAIRRIGEAIAAAGTVQDLETAGAEIQRLRTWLGEPALAPLIAAYQARFEALLEGGNKQATTKKAP